MTTITPNTGPAVPPEADLTWIDNWEVNNGSAYRLIWSRPLPLGGAWSVPNPGFADTDVRVVVTQFADGSIGTAEPDAPLVYIGQDDYTPETARALGTAILAAADLADQWAGVTR